MDNLTGQKVVIISDLHLRKKFNNKKFEAIKLAVAGADKLILNGDIWEGAAINFGQFLASPWQTLFPIFKNKKAVYLYGNHDQERMVDESCSVFCDLATKHYDFIQNGVKFHVRHGDELSPTFDQKHPSVPFWIYSIISALEKETIHWFGKPFLQIYYKDNQRMLAWKQSNLPKEDWLVCGHSHLAMLDVANKFINSGIFELPVASYLVVENGKPELIWV